MRHRFTRTLAGGVLMAGAALSFGLSSVPIASAASPSPSWAINTRPLPADTSHFTAADWASYGVYPDMSGPGQFYNASPVTLSSAAAPDVIPDSHYGCNGNVCIDVEGTGTVVSSWGTSAVLSNQCTYGVWLRDNSVKYTGPTYCGSGNTGLVERPGAPFYFNVGDQLCNEWPGVSGKPCATIE